jgi:hypothetical protein
MTARRLWFPLVAPPVAFGVVGFVGWWAGTQICTSLSIGAARLWVGIVSLAMLIVALGGLAMSIRSYRDAGATRRVAGDRVGFMLLGGVLVSTSLVVGLVWSALNALFITGCGRMR